MSTTSDFDRLARAWLDEGPTQISEWTLNATLDEVHVTQQRRAVRVPWRFVYMPALSRATGIAAAVALVAVVGASGILYFTSIGAGGPGRTASPEPSPTHVAPGITDWTTWTSALYGFTFGFPTEWSARAPATRKWLTGDAFPADSVPYADTFVSPGEGDAQIGLLVWDMPAGRGADVESVDFLKAWAETFCTDVIASSCDSFTQDALRMSLAEPDPPYGAAILVPTAAAQYAFIGDCNSCLISQATDYVRVVVIAREDSFPPAARYGGSVELLKSILTTMDVWMPGQQTRPAGWIRGLK